MCMMDMSVGMKVDTFSALKKVTLNTLITNTQINNWDKGAICALECVDVFVPSVVHACKRVTRTKQHNSPLILVS